MTQKCYPPTLKFVAVPLLLESGILCRLSSRPLWCLLHFVLQCFDAWLGYVAMGGLGSLALARQASFVCCPGGPPGETFPVNRAGSDGGRDWSQGQSQKEEERDGGSGTGELAQGPLAEEGGLFFDIFVVTPRVPCCLLRHGQFEEPVHPCMQPVEIIPEMT